MREDWDGIFSYGAIPSIARCESMGDEKISLDIGLIGWVEVDVCEEFFVFYGIRSLQDALFELNISIRIGKCVRMDLMVWCPDFCKWYKLIFWTYAEWEVDICMDSRRMNLWLECVVCLHFELIVELWRRFTKSVLHFGAHIWVDKCETSRKKDFAQKKSMIISDSFFLFSEKCKKQGNMRHKSKMIKCTYLAESRKSIPSVDREPTEDKIDKRWGVGKHFWEEGNRGSIWIF